MTTPGASDPAAPTTAGSPRGGRPSRRLDDLTVERVLRTVEHIPPGRVAAYGQVGAIAGVGARQTGRIMAQWGSSAPWWRVTSASGELPPGVLERARGHWAEEGTPVRPDGRGVRIRQAGADLGALREAAHRAWADLPEA
ncbi:MGMT family protein [Brachybacterium huguangmaarense]